MSQAKYCVNNNNNKKKKKKKNRRMHNKGITKTAQQITHSSTGGCAAIHGESRIGFISDSCMVWREDEFMQSSLQ